MDIIIITKNVLYINFMKFIYTIQYNMKYINKRIKTNLPENETRNILKWIMENENEVSEDVS